MSVTTTSPALAIGPLRMAGSGAATLVALYVVCWIGQFMNLPVAHTYLGLFTAADPASLAALGLGVVWSAIFGALAGALLALFYNVLGTAVRK
jgi:hypothetical protein